MNQTIPTDNILTLVEAILKNRALPDGEGSTMKIMPGENAYGLITSPIGRGLWTAFGTLRSALAEMIAEHEKFHNCVLGPTGEHTC